MNVGCFFEKRSSLTLIVVATLAFVANAFVPRPSLLSQTTIARNKQVTTNIVVLQAQGSSGGAPVIAEWKVLGNGRVTGTVTNHPVIEDGDIITTSPLADPKSCKANGVVVTTSGSRYKLAQPKVVAVVAAAKAVNENGVVTKKKNGVLAPPNKAKLQKPAPVKKPVVKKTELKNGVAVPVQKLGYIDEEKKLKLELAKARKELNLSGQALGPDGTYWLAGKARRSTSGKSSIWTCYKGDSTTGMPMNPEQPLTIKISQNKEALKRERDNYKKAAGLLGRGGQSFVTFYEYLSPAGKRPPFSKQCAIVMQQGDLDLKAYLEKNGPLEGKPLREAAVAAIQCLQALHQANLVWTDLKTENFVVIEDEDSGKLLFKGIDLESAMPHKDNPVDYSPEACPPEFAESFLSGEGPYFILDYSYDVWSLGMMLHEMATGKCMFDKKNPTQITKLLRSSSEWKPDVSDVADDKLQDLITKCLEMDPKKRPRMTQILLHPYFLTTGFGPLSF